MNQAELDLKRKQYEIAVKYAGYFGHRYHGFEGHTGKYGYSQSETDDRKRVLRECAWVWDRKVSKWIKKPEVSQ